MDDSLISETLEALSDGHTARKMRKQISTLRGIRGTPQSEIARIGTAVWNEDRPRLDDEDALGRLFSASWEDGLLAIGLLAALTPDGPAEVFDIGLDWLSRVDDLATADALGWLVLGPGFAASGPDAERLAAFAQERKANGHPAVRRATLAMGLAFMPIPIQGPSAAPLRARVGEKTVQFVEAPLSPLVAVLANTFLRDEDPSVRKAMRRMLRSWVKTDPNAVCDWVDSVRGGLPKMLSAETKRARRR